MEKFANTIGKFFGFGLLVLFLPNVFAQSSKRFTSADAAKLLLAPSESIVFTEMETHFELKVNGVPSAEIQMELPVFPETVKFNSSRYEDFTSLQGTERGTNIDLNFTFTAAGEFSLPPIVLVIQGVRYLVKFKAVQVFNNPQTILPRIVVKFENGEMIFDPVEKQKNSKKENQVKKIALEVGRPVKFTIYLQYGTQLHQFAWSIPKDSLFRELKRYDVKQFFQEKPGQDTPQFPTEQVPVALFEWIPLAEGRTSLPDIRFVATSYSGREVYLAMPECIVDVLPASAAADDALSNEANPQNPIFAYAFTKEENILDDETKDAIDVFELAEIARLRSEERHSFFQSRVRAQRLQKEEKIGIQNSYDEQSIPLFILFASMCVVFVAAVVVFHLAHKKTGAVFAAVLAFISLFFTVVFSHKTFDRCGIVIGGSLSPVPEDSALTKTAAGVGSRVVVREEIENWYYVEHNESGGWIKKENLVLIK